MTCEHQQYSPEDPVVARLGLGAAALRYAQWGYAVVPLERGGKKPHRMLPERGGLHHGTTDPARIEQWWSLDRAANVGVLTGRLSCLMVIDLDVKGAANGIESFAAAWPLLGLAMPGTVGTPSGGQHIWLRSPSGIPVPERPAILPGVDVKGDGGLVVAPPSMALVHGSGAEVRGGAGEVPVPYGWQAGCFCRALMLPAALYQWARTAPATGTVGDGLPDADLPEIEEAERAGFREGARNASLYRMACSMYRRFGLTPAGCQETWRRLKAMHDASDAGMGERELRVLAESARRFAEGAMASDAEGMRRSEEWLRQFR